MTKLINKFHSRLKDFGIADFIKISNTFFLLMAYVFLLLGILGSILIILMPTIDDVFLRNMLDYISSKYQSLDDSQKNEIRKIFHEIFIDTNTATIVNKNR